MACVLWRRCCCCVPLEIGCLLLAFASAAACGVVSGWCAWELRAHRSRRNEDNMVLMSVVMFATLSLLSDLGIALGILRRRAGWVQVSLVSNAVFWCCLVLVGAVACLFSPALRPLFASAPYIALAAVLMIAAAVYAAYYLTVVNSVYTRMKSVYGDTAVPV